MALSDYCLCDVCECKTFYDAVLDYAGGKTRGDGKLMPCRVGDMRVICQNCSQSYAVIIVPLDDKPEKAK